MSKQLDKRQNVVQLKGNLFTLAIKYFLARLSRRNDYFMKTGGAVGDDRAYKMAAMEVRKKIGDNAIHVVAVASGDLLQALKSSFTNVVGILTQPWYLKLSQRIRLPDTRGITGSSIQNRERLVFHIYQKTGLAFDPVFMGSVLEYIMRKGRDLDHVCLWVTCPSIVSDYLHEQLGQ